MEQLKPILENQSSFSDCFVGGGSVLLEVAKQYPTLDLYANDKDYSVYCFWKIIADTNHLPLGELLQLMSVQPTIELFDQLRETKATNEIEHAYRAIFFNRCCFSGILSSGAIGGKLQSGKYKVDCRYNFNKLKEKMLACHSLLSGRTLVSNNDFNNHQYLTITNQPIYLDPPYVKKGNALYPQGMQIEEHQQLSAILHKRKNWLLSYDDCQEVRDLYQDKVILDKAVRYSINGKKTDWKKYERTNYHGGE